MPGTRIKRHQRKYEFCIQNEVREVKILLLGVTVSAKTPSARAAGVDPKDVMETAGWRRVLALVPFRGRSLKDI